MIGGAFLGAIVGGLNTALMGGGVGDVLRGAAIGAVQGAITAGALHGLQPASGTAGFNMKTAIHVAGHGVVGGAANAAMGGKFQDGFVSGAVSAAAADLGAFDGIKGDTSAAVFGRTAMAGIVGGTASALGGGKFANGAVTGAFHHLVNAEASKFYADQKAKTGLPILSKLDPRLARMIGVLQTSEHPVWVYLDMDDTAVAKMGCGGRVYIRKIPSVDFFSE